MLPRYRFSCSLACWLALTMITGCNRSQPASTEATGATTVPSQSQRIAVLFRDAEDPFSQAIRDGITVGSQEFDLQLEWMPTTAEDSSRQVKLLQKAIDEQLKAICIAPITVDEVAAPLEAAAEVGIPVVALERSLPDNVPLLSFVSTDHFHLGRIMAQYLAQRVEPGSVLLLNGAADDAATARRQGFKYTLGSAARWPVIECNCQQSAVTALQDALQQHEPVAAIVALDAPSTEAALKLCREEPLDAAVFGYGAWNGIGTDIQQGRLAATILEDPYIIGYSAMMALSTHFEGGENLEFIMPEPTIVTAENLEEENAKRLLESNLRSPSAGGKPPT